MSSNGPRRRGGGTIGILCAELARYTRFHIDMMRLERPDGARFVYPPSSDIVGQMNEMCRQMVGDWLWVIGDDHCFQPDIIHRLLAHDADVVVPFCLKRTAPYDPVVFSGQNGKGEYRGFRDLPHDEGLVEIHAAGSAGMLIRKHVLDAIGDPWFTTDGSGMNEDLTFCGKVRDAGFTIWCDTSTKLGHIGHLTVWPQWKHDRWMVAADLGNGHVIDIDWIAQPEAVIA